MAQLGMLETLGTAHGRPFEPDEHMTATLTEAAPKMEGSLRTAAARRNTASNGRVFSS
jgi:hypothetical protein